MNNRKSIYMIIMLIFALSGISCAKNKNESENLLNKTYINNSPFWIENIPKDMSPSEVVEYTKNIASKVSCTNLLDSRYDPRILVKVNSYRFLNKDFQINFYFNESELYAVSLVALNEVSFPQSLDDAKKYIQFFSDKYGIFPKVKQEKGFITSNSYMWKKDHLETGIFITMVESDTAVFTLTFTDARIKQINKKQNSKYLHNCRQLEKNKPMATKTRHANDFPSPAIPPHSYPVIPSNKK